MGEDIVGNSDHIIKQSLKLLNRITRIHAIIKTKKNESYLITGVLALITMSKNVPLPLLDEDRVLG